MQIGTGTVLQEHSQIMTQADSSCTLINIGLLLVACADKELGSSWLGNSCTFIQQLQAHTMMMVVTAGPGEL